MKLTGRIGTILEENVETCYFCKRPMRVMFDTARVTFPDRLLENFSLNPMEDGPYACDSCVEQIKQDEAYL